MALLTAKSNIPKNGLTVIEQRPGQPYRTGMGKKLSARSHVLRVTWRDPLGRENPAIPTEDLPLNWFFRVRGNRCRLVGPAEKEPKTLTTETVMARTPSLDRPIEMTLADELDSDRQIWLEGAISGIQHCVDLVNTPNTVFDFMRFRQLRPDQVREMATMLYDEPGLQSTFAAPTTKNVMEMSRTEYDRFIKGLDARIQALEAPTSPSEALEWPSRLTLKNVYQKAYRRAFEDSHFDVLDFLDDVTCATVMGAINSESSRKFEMDYPNA